MQRILANFDEFVKDYNNEIIPGCGDGGCYEQELMELDLDQYRREPEYKITLNYDCAKDGETHVFGFTIIIEDQDPANIYDDTELATIYYDFHWTG